MIAHQVAVRASQSHGSAVLIRSRSLVVSSEVDSDLEGSRDIAFSSFLGDWILCAAGQDHLGWRVSRSVKCQLVAMASTVVSNTLESIRSSVGGPRRSPCSHRYVSRCLQAKGDRVGAKGNDFRVDRGQMRQDSVEVGRVTDFADQLRIAVGGLGEHKVVDEWPQDPGASSAPKHDFVGGWLGHAPMLTIKGMREPRAATDLTQVRSICVTVATIVAWCVGPRVAS